MNSKNIKYYLLYGCDVSNQIYDVGESLPSDDKNLRSDTIILVILNKKTNKVKIVSLLRDIAVEVKGHGKCKLNSLIVYFGPKKTTKIINNLFDINVSKYVVLDMENMVKIVDIIGGVDINLKKEEVEFINHWSKDTTIITNYKGNANNISKEGINHLNGLQTLTHARNRYYGYTWARTRRQREILIAMAKQIKNNTNSSQLINIGLSILKYVKTNINLFDIIFISSLINKINLNEISTYPLPNEKTNGISDSGMWRFEIDFNLAKEYLQKIINDEDVEDFVL